MNNDVMYHKTSHDLIHYRVGKVFQIILELCM